LAIKIQSVFRPAIQLAESEAFDQLPTTGRGPGQTSTIYTGQLDIDMYDAAKHRLVWRGVASKSLDPKARPEKRQKNLNKAVAKLMKNYPRPAKK
jgi:hypothetical protein